MKKQLSFKQRLALLVHKATPSLEHNASFPYGFEAYVEAVAKLRNSPKNIQNFA
jgi:hypothetical protein